MSKATDYYGQDRSEFLDWVGGDFRRVLDVGCGSGSNAGWYRRHAAQEIVGVELDKTSAALAESVFDRVVWGPIETAIPELDGNFDLIVCADVLEHLVDPWSVVTQLRNVAHVSTVFAVSIPNIRFLPAIARIAIGSGFRYAEQGLFDSTHLRFFTRPDVYRLLHEGGWVPRRWGGHSYGRYSPVHMLARRLSRGWSDQWLAEQLFVVARVGPSKK